MAVYIDKYNAAFGRMKMSHMMADSTEELLAMVDRIGVNRKWIQKQNTKREHFDVCSSKRKLAISFGAIEVTTKELVLRIQKLFPRENEVPDKPGFVEHPVDPDPNDDTDYVKDTDTDR